MTEREEARVLSIATRVRACAASLRAFSALLRTVLVEKSCSHRGVGNNLPLSPAAEDIDVGFVAERRRLVERRIATVALCFAEALRKSCHEEGKEKSATCCSRRASY